MRWTFDHQKIVVLRNPLKYKMSEEIQGKCREKVDKLKYELVAIFSSLFGFILI